MSARGIRLLALLAAVATCLLASPASARTTIASGDSPRGEHWRLQAADAADGDVCLYLVLSHRVTGGHRVRDRFSDCGFGVPGVRPVAVSDLVECGAGETVVFGPAATTVAAITASGRHARMYDARAPLAYAGRFFVLFARRPPASIVATGADGATVATVRLDRERPCPTRR